VLEDYRRYWVYQDCRLEYCMPVPVYQPVTEEILRMPDWRRQPILNEFLLKIDAPHFMPTWLCKTPTKAVSLSLQGTRQRGPFEARDIEQLRRLVPHVTRALKIRDRLEAANVRASTLASVIDRVSFGILTLSSGGRILESNIAAEQMLRSEKVLRSGADRRLTIPDPAGSWLQRWLADRSRAARPAERLVRISRGSGRAPISALAIPMPERPVLWVSVDPACILFLFDPERQAVMNLELVAADLAISAREAAIATHLAAGLELSQVAQRMRISIHTARSHLKAIYAKTGIGSQAELVRRVVSGPAAHSGDKGV
jgi:DNA-binding CsgD family transcriptional regulator